MTVTTIKNYTLPRTGEKYEVKTDESPEILSVLDSLQSSLTKEYELGERVKSELDSLKPKYDSLDGEKVALESKIQKLESDLESAKNTRMDSSSIKSWLKTFEKVKDVFTSDSVDPFDLDELGLKKAYLAPLYPDVKLDEKSPDFIEGIWFQSQNSPKNHTEETKKHLDGLTPDEVRTDSIRGDVSSRSKNLITLK
jgi:hypothetical protein